MKRGKLLLRVVLFGLAVAILLVVAALLALQTPWARELIARRAEAILGDVLVGEVRIGSIDGFLPTDLVLNEVVLTDAQQRPAITARRVAVHLSLWPLLHRRLEVAEVSVEAPTVLLIEEGDSVNLATLVPPAAPSVTSTVSSAPWTIVASSIRVDDAKFTFLGSTGSSILVDRIQVRAHATLVGTELSGVLDRFEARLDAPRFFVVAAGRVEVDANSVKVAGVSATIDGATRVEDGTFSIDLDSGHLLARVEAALPTRAFGDRFAVPGLLAPAQARVRLERPGFDRRWWGSVEGTLAGTPLTVSATASQDFSAIEGRLVASALDPAALYEGAPAGTLDVGVDVSLDDYSLEEMHGALSASVGGSIVPALGLEARTVHLTLEASADRGSLTSHFEVKSGRSALGGEATVDLRPLTLSEARIRAWVPDLEAFTAGVAPLHGALSATVSADGPLDDLKGKISARVDGLAIGATRDPLVQSAVLEADATLDDHRLEVVIPGLEADLGGSTLRLTVERARLLRRGGGSIEGGTITSEAGEITFGASLTASTLTKPGWILLHAKELDLERLRADFFPRLPVLAGVGRADVAIELGPSPRASVDASFSDVRGAGTAQTAQARALLMLERGTLTASITGSGSHAGSIGIWATAKAPRTPYEPAAWANLGPGAMTELDARFRGLDLAELSAFYSGPLGLEGHLDGTVVAGPALAAGTARFELRELRYPGLPGPITANVEAVLEARRSQAFLVAAIGDQPLASITLELAAGLPVLVEALPRALKTADAAVSFEVAQIPIALLADVAPADPSTLEISKVDELGGEVSVRGQVERTRGRLRGDLWAFARGASWAKDGPPLTATVAVTLEGLLVDLKSEISGERIGRIELSGHGTIPSDPYEPGEWARLGVKAIDEVHLITTELDVASFDLLSGRRLPAKGTMTAELIATSGLTSIEAHLTLRRAGRRGTAPFGDAELYLRADPRQTLLDLAVFREDRPVLTASAAAEVGTADLGHLRERLRVAQFRAGAALEQLPLDVLAETIGLGAPLKGTLSATAGFAGTPDRYRGKLYVDASKAQVRSQKFDRFDVDATVIPQRVVARASVEVHDGGWAALDTRVGLIGERAPVEAHFRSDDLRLDFLSAFFQGQNAVGGIGGFLDAELVLDGTRNAPVFSGTATIADFAIVMASPGPSLERTTIAVSFDGDGLVLDADGHSGDGTFTAKGKAQLQAIDRGTAEVQIETDELQFSAGPRLAEIDSSIHVEAVFGEAVDVAVEIQRASVEIPNQSAEELRAIRTFDDVLYLDEERRARAFGEVAARSIPMSIRIETREPIPLKGREISATAEVSLAFQSSGGPVSSSGKIAVSDGWVVLFNRRWQIQRADITLGDDGPELDIEITRDLGTAVATVRVTGSPNAPEIALSSDPPIYDESQLLLFLLGADPGTESEAALQSRATGVVAGALTGSLQTRLEDALPLDTINVEVGDGATVSRVSVGKWITQRIFVGYDYSFDAEEDENASEGVLQIRLGRGWMVESRYGDRGAGGLDVIWVKRF